MKTKKKVKDEVEGKRRGKAKAVRAARIELVASVRAVFETEVPDTLLLGEVRSALASPKRRDITRGRIIACLFRGRQARVMAREMSKVRPAWMSELSHLRMKKALKKYKKARGG
jgi:hypothetical protein